MATQKERRDTTRQQILTAAHALFVERGYVETSIAEVQAAAGISRGAVYHHFAAKEDLFAAVFIRTSSDAVRHAVAQIPPGSTAEDALIAGCLGWLSAVDDPGTRRILLVDGPVALGWERARSLEEATSFRSMRTAVQTAVGRRGMSVGSVDLAAKLINAALAEAALATEPGNRAASKRTEKLITAMIRGLIKSL